MNKLNNTLSSAFCETIKGETIQMAGNVLEIGLDELMDNEVLKSIPFVSIVISAYRIGATIREREHLKKLAVFLQEIEEGCASEDKRNEYAKKFSKDAGFRSRELEYVIVLLDRYINYNKPRWLARLYLAYLDGRVNWDEFLQYAEIVDQLLPGDETFLRFDRVPQRIRTGSYEGYVNRFRAMGLLVQKYRTEVVYNRAGAPIEIKIPLRDQNSKFGEKLFRIIF